MKDTLRDLAARAAYFIAWVLFTLGISGLKSPFNLKKLYAKAMAARYCEKKDRKFCELAFERLYFIDISQLLRKGEAPLVLSLILYDLERGDYALSATRTYAESGVLPTEFGVYTGRIDIERLIPHVAGLLKSLGGSSVDTLIAAWQLTAVRTRLIPPLEKLTDNLFVAAILAEMEKRGFVRRVDSRFELTESGVAIASEIKIPGEVSAMLSMKYVTPIFYVLLNAPPERI